ncbi:4'-phosphopantetheinyl transferase superfamily protein [Rhodobacteraceae bacterium CCMM004]|nr:4'-phosphopantetheinyl transferase superfamily protein [Rhodobacteraceae bacterium CCMM004]
MSAAPASAVDLWVWPIGAPADADRALLSADESARADRFVFDRDRDRFVAARAGLRRALAAVTGTAADALAFAYEQNGKPRIDGGPVFNLSHSGDLAALAVAAGGVDPILGLDIEAPRAVERDLPERVFSAAERAELAALPDAAWEAGFFAGWTRKEAVIKALGDGLSMPLDSFDVTLGPDAPARVLRMPPGRPPPEAWTLVPFRPQGAVVGAVAWAGGGGSLRLLPRGAP